LYPLNAERLARKQSVPLLTPLARRGRGSNPRPPDYEANALCTRPPSRFLLLLFVSLYEGGSPDDDEDDDEEQEDNDDDDDDDDDDVDDIDDDDHHLVLMISR